MKLRSVSLALAGLLATVAIGSGEAQALSTSLTGARDRGGDTAHAKALRPSPAEKSEVDLRAVNLTRHGGTFTFSWRVAHLPKRAVENTYYAMNLRTSDGTVYTFSASPTGHYRSVTALSSGGGYLYYCDHSGRVSSDLRHSTVRWSGVPASCFPRGALTPTTAQAKSYHLNPQKPRVWDSAPLRQHSFRVR